MKVVKISDVKPEEATGQIFRGKVSRQLLIGENEGELRASVVNFTAGAVNIFHTHTVDQILYVTDGKGKVATESEEITVTPGTIIFIPAGEKHWHGAIKESPFSHLVIMPTETTHS